MTENPISSTSKTPTLAKQYHEKYICQSELFFLKNIFGLFFPFKGEYELKQRAELRRRKAK